MKTHQMILIALIFFSFLLFADCYSGPDSSRGFSLPKGDTDRGKMVFLEYECLVCHSIADTENHGINKELSKIILLGGEVTQIKTYGELATLIINPSHKIAKGYAAYQVTTEDDVSHMRNHNDLMTITGLIDLVAYLQSCYTLKPFDQTSYPLHYP
ncbi:MAG: sulfur-oxidizing protein SoxX [Lentisphaeria bacterium]|jgi:sulfur-oxidizing protein SoxX